MQFVNNEPAVSPVDDDSSGDDTRSPGVPGVSPPPGPAAPPQAGNATQPPEYISSIVVVEPAPGFSMTGRDFDTLVGAVKPKKEKGKVSFFELFRFATALDLTVTVLGACASAGAGVLMPIFTLLMGSMIDSFGTGSSSSTVESSESQVANSGGIDTSSLNKNAKYMVYIGAAGFVLQFISALCLNTSARNQAMRIRKLFYRATLRQEMGWFDSQKVGGLTVYLSDVTTIQKGIGEKIGMFAEVFSTLIAGWVIGFVKGWKMSLLILAAVPLIVITFGLMNVAFQKYVNKAQLFYNKAGQIAQEILGSIRTVTSLGIQKQSLTRYNEALEVTRDMGYRKGISTGLSFGMMMLILQGIFGLAFWYGSTLIDGPAKWVNGVFHRDSEMSTGDVIIVFFSILQGAMGLAMLSPTVNAVMEASGAAYPVFKIIDRESKIDPSIEEGRRPEIRDISFQNITFHYPTRPQANVLNGFTLNIKKGQTVALVGPSGCGKSTLVGLLQRFYDVEEGCGEVLLDGESIKTINIAHLRSQIGIVSQEPVLFATTIGQNIMYGTNKPVTMDDVIRVSKMANAHDFISKLPQGYETVVGERGVMLSGGQKQRIAIARTLIREPQIMLFDEATSALDTESEGVVQEAIDKISKGRTSIIIAHRLSTVRHADLIVAVNGGKVSEMGTHDELMARKGLYFGLVEKQRLQGKNETKKLKRSALKESIRANEAEQKKEKESESNNATLSQIIQRAYSLMAPNAIWVSWAIVGAIVNGAVQPCQSLLMSSMMQTLMKIAYVPDNSSYKSEIKYYSLGFLGIGFAALIANILQNSCIEVAGSRLTTMLRQESFKAMLRQEIGWFDDEHPTGVLSTRLASDSSAVHSLTGSQMCLIVQMFSSVATGLAIAFAGSWKLALVVMCAVPFIIISSYMHIQSLTGTDEGTRKMYEKSGQVATESLENIRTVAALGKETMFIGQVDYLLNTTKVASYKSYFVNAVGRGIQAISQNWMTALAFWYGGKLAKSDGLSITGLFRALFGIMFGTMTIGQSSSNLADIGKALTSCNHIFELIDRKPHIPPVEGLEISNKRLLPPKKNWPVHIEDPKIEKKLQSLRLSTNADMEISTSPLPGIVEAPMAIKDLHGHIEFREIQFEYPSRPGARILRGLNLVIRPRQTVALVGPSGCGKSTVIGLLERFYDPLSGEVFVDGRPLNTLSLSWIRSQIGHVGQEPTLFAMTIRENILYGKPEASMEEVVAAAKSANAHNFIMTFPLKYETMIGERGVSLSGGQKQRIAIARALLRNPRILLLDEATSALDADSERIVQEALDRAREGRTTIVIAHRLSTVVNADQIVVINRGKVAEAGTHNELLALGGLYSRLAAAQM